ncbi:MAG: Lipoprotein-releasing system ATP-binding protein LolD [Verrucomicrobiae bacterium]|nr:Lipoprotein-releasing system ATP-binding protein LolD [Verrucomicrobiae bacterium]
MSDPILSARDLRKTYRLGKHTVEVLKGVNLAVRPGEVVVIVGASGAGKSTLLHLLGGLDKPTTGDVLFEGARLSTLNRTRWRNERVGFVFQSYNLLPELDALENVCVPAMVAGRREVARGRELLAAVGLGDRLEHRPAELSGGEQQRVAIARALMNKPTLLLADEPTGNLDDKTSETILDLLWKMRAETGATLVMVTHDQHVAKRGERVLEIVEGRIR